AKAAGGRQQNARPSRGRAGHEVRGADAAIDAQFEEVTPTSRTLADILQGETKMGAAPAWKADRLRTREQQARARRENKLKSFRPYERQNAFFEMGATKRERLLMAGTQVGKSEAGAFETACHLTGL